MKFPRFLECAARVLAPAFVSGKPHQNASCDVLRCACGWKTGSVIVLEVVQEESGKPRMVPQREDSKLLCGEGTVGE